MHKWLLLLGLAAVLAALMIAGGQAVLAHETLRANAALARIVITIPLAAAVRL
jgi:hypothetical protein